MNTSEIKERAAANERLRALEAMERLVLALGTRRSYVQWLECWPESAVLNSNGCIAREDMAAVAADADAYNDLVKAYAALMEPVLHQISQA